MLSLRLIEVRNAARSQGSARILRSRLGSRPDLTVLSWAVCLKHNAFEDARSRATSATTPYLTGGSFGSGGCVLEIFAAALLGYLPFSASFMIVRTHHSSIHARAPSSDIPPRSLRFICVGIIFHPVGDVWCETRYPPVQGQEQKRQRHAGQEASAVNWAMLAPAALPSARPSELPWVPKSSYAEAAVTTEFHDLSWATPCQGLAPSWGRTKNILFIGGGVLGGLHSKMHVN